MSFHYPGKGVVSLWPEDASLKDFLLHHKEKPSTSQKSSPRRSPKRSFIEVDLNKEDLPNLKRSRVQPNSEETPLVLRKYQEELAEDARNGENCIINAPTGSGKTVVAAWLIKNHLATKGEEKKVPKVLFLISSTAIIEQQKQQLGKFLSHSFDVESICGSDGMTIGESSSVIRTNDVIVCTPQIIVNLLQIEEIDEERRKEFRLDEFSLIVFDECHNATGRSPYSVLMEHYHRAVNSGKYENPPQIIGLTASLGVGGTTAGTLEALRHITRLCATLDCKMISVVREHVNELEEFSPLTADERYIYNNDDDSARLEYLESILSLMQIVENRTSHLLRDADQDVSNGENSQILNERESSQLSAAPEDKFSFGYLNWIMNHIWHILPRTMLPERIRLLLTECFEILQILYRTLELCEGCSTHNSYDYLKEEMRNNVLSREMKEILSGIDDFESLTTEKCVLVDALENHIVDQYRKNRNFRAIVFVKTRIMARTLSAMLNKRGRLLARSITSEPLFGVNAVGDGASIKELSEKLSGFRWGITNLLVSTSVAEEGLDIAQCNLVIKYNYTTNEIAHVQRRGRARAKNSRCILVTNSQKLMEQEEDNMKKERLMKEAMKRIQNDREYFANEVEREIQSLRMEIERADLKSTQNLEKLQADETEYELRCRKCNSFLCSHNEIKTDPNRTQFCVIEPDFWNRIELEIIPEGAVFKKELYTPIGQIFCKGENCGLSIGCVVCDYKVPVLKAKSLVIVHKNVRETVKSWKKIQESYFRPPVFRQAEVDAMRRASLVPLKFTGSISTSWLSGQKREIEESRTTDLAAAPESHGLAIKRLRID